MGQVPVGLRGGYVGFLRGAGPFFELAPRRTRRLWSHCFSSLLPGAFRYGNRPLMQLMTKRRYSNELNIR